MIWLPQPLPVKKQGGLCGELTIYVRKKNVVCSYNEKSTTFFVELFFATVCFATRFLRP